MQYTGKIKDCKIDFSPLQSYIEQNDGKGFVLKLEAGNNVKFWQHQYYRGFLWKALADNYGEKNYYYFHDYILKPLYYEKTTGKSFIPAEGYNNIPEKHQAGSRKIEFFTEEEGKAIIMGYIPSCADMTQKEMRGFILFCEDILCDFYEWSRETLEKNEVRKNAKL